MIISVKMKNKPEIELLNSISETHNDLYFFTKELRQLFPETSFRFDLSMCSTDREEWPVGAIGITWEINMDERSEVFFFEITNESQWHISAELSQPGLETIEIYFDLLFDELSEALTCLSDLVDQFQQCYKQHLKNQNNSD